MLVNIASPIEERFITSLVKHCPELRITAIAHSHEKAIALLPKIQPKLLFYDLDPDNTSCENFLNKMDEEERDTVIISDKSPSTDVYSHKTVSGLLHKPIEIADLVVTVRNIANKISLKGNSNSPKSKISIGIDEIVGIPKFDGFEYLNVNQIIRCEGLQKCTRVISEGRKEIISSYPIGAFKKLLIPFGFYDVHRSHIINLRKVYSCSREGYIFLADGSQVPLARRKRNQFLNSWNILKIR